MHCSECQIFIPDHLPKCPVCFSDTSTQSAVIVDTDRESKAPQITSRTTSRPNRPSVPGSRNTSRRYFALNANPNTYRVQEAVTSLETDYWTTGRSRLSPGDRVLIWKSYGRQGRSARRGIVAFGEVLESAKPQPAFNEFWVRKEDGQKVVDRIKVRYVLPPNLPLWEDEHPELKRLTVCGGQGTVFVVPPELFDYMISIAGGWPVAEIQENLSSPDPRSTGSPRTVQEKTEITIDQAVHALNETNEISGNSKKFGNLESTYEERRPASLWNGLARIFRRVFGIQGTFPKRKP